MEKLTIVGNFLKSVEYLRNTECSQREKVQHFHHISDCLASPSMISNEHCGRHVSSGINVLLLFCEDLDSVVRMSAEENLNKVIRSVENTRLSRVLLDLYNEIKKNGNQKSLRICLNLFAHYSPRMKEKNVKWYALKLLPCLQVIAQRKETLLIETLADFVKSFSVHMQNCLNDNENLKLLEIFLADITSDCSVKRRCSAQNCINLIQGARCKKTLAKKSLFKALDYLHSPLSTNNIIGVMGFLRLLLPLIISYPECENKQIIEIYDLCLHLLNNCNHSIINASLEVINAILSGLSPELKKLITSNDVHQNDFLKKRKSLKNQIFQLTNAEMTCIASTSVPSTMLPSSCSGVGRDGGEVGLNQQHALGKSSTQTIKDAFKSGKMNTVGGDGADEQLSSESDATHSKTANAGQDLIPSALANRIKVNDEATTTQVSSSPDEFCRVIVDNVDDVCACTSTTYANKMTSSSATSSTSITPAPEINEPQEDGHLHCTEDKSQILSDVDNESFNSIDFESEITIGIGNDGIDYEMKKDKDDADVTSTGINKENQQKDKDGEKTDAKSLKSADSIGAFFNNLLSHPNTGTMTKLFRPSSKASNATAINHSSSPTLSSASRTKRKRIVDVEEMESKSQLSLKLTACSGSGTGSTGMTALTFEDDTISLESLSSHISLSSHVSQQSRNEHDLMLAPGNDSDIGRKFDGATWYEGAETFSLQQDPPKFLGGINLNASAKSGSQSYTSDSQTILPDAPFQSPRKADLGDGGRFNPFDDGSKLRLKIGTIYEQNILHYTARLVASNFLLSGAPGGLVSDALVRVSIKSLSLALIANCVELKPEILYLPLEIDKSDSTCSEMSPDMSNENSSGSGSAHELYADCQSEDTSTEKSIPEIHPEENFLEIKDDHFGVSTNPFLFDCPLSKSVDQAVLTQLQRSVPKQELEIEARNKSSMKLNDQLGKMLSTSEIIQSNQPRKQGLGSSTPQRKQHSQSTTQNFCPLNMPIVPHSESKQDIKKGEKERKECDGVEANHFLEYSIDGNKMDSMNSPRPIQLSRNQNRDYEEQQSHGVEQKQFIHDIFLYSNHTDPVLRGNMQIIACNFAKACLFDLPRFPVVNEPTSLIRAEHHDKQLLLDGPFDIEKLLTILIKGLRDDIHTVVIQALNSFDKLFCLLMPNYFMEHTSCSQYEESCKDEIDTTLTESLFDNILERSQKAQISPKLLLNQLQFCFANKYWLVQNKYADVISNLDLQAIRAYYNDDVAVTYEHIFLEQLWQLLGDDDVRVRDHVAVCLANYIKRERNLGIHSELKAGFDYDRKLIDEFLMQRVFRGMSKTLCEVLNEGRLMNENICSLLARILFLMTNKLMDLDKKNMQFGIINAIRVLVNEFNPIDHLHVWNEFNFAELCLCFMLQNFTTAMDIHMQISLIEINTKLLSANLLVGNCSNKTMLVEQLFDHILRILSIYYFLFSNQKPPTVSSKSPKSDLIFVNTKESTSHSTEETSRDHLYTKLYGVLKIAFDNYKISINKESGNKLMSLAACSLNALSALLEFKQNTNAPSGSVKLIEEALQYLTVIVNYLPIETINCLRQLLKFLFCRNYGNRKVEYENFLKLYFAIRNCEWEENRIDCKADKVATGVEPEGGNEPGHEKHEHGDCNRIEYEIERQSGGGNRKKDDRKDFVGSGGDRFNLSELFASAISFPLSKSKLEEDCAKHIKLFEPLVIYCLTLFMKSNATVQATILDMLSDLLDFNVTYSILDSKNIIYEQVESNIELIESGTVRNVNQLIRSTIRFLVKLTRQSDKKLISIPKIISIINNLFINNTLQECSVIALRELAFEIFFKAPKLLIYSPDRSKEHNAEREVVLGMLEKYINSIECQKMLATLLLWSRVGQTKVIASDATASAVASATPIDPISATTSASCDSSVEQQSPIVVERAILSIVIGALQNGGIIVNNCETYFVLDAIFRNCDKSILLGSDLFESLLGLFIERHVENFNNLSHAVIILDNVILKTEQIYLANHVKLLFMKNSIQLNAAKSVLVEGRAELNMATIEPEKPPQKEQTKKFASRPTGDLGVAVGTSLSNDDEINYFVKVLYSILETCFSTSIAHPCDTNYRYLTSTYISLLEKVVVKFDKMRVCLRTLLSHSNTLFEKLETSSQSLDELKAGILTLLCELCLGRDEGDSSSSNPSSFCLVLQPRSILQCIQKIKKTNRQQGVLSRVCEKFKDINWWMAEDIKVLLSVELLQSFLEIRTKLKSEITEHPVYSRVLMEQLIVLPTAFCKDIITSILELITKINVNASFLKLKFLWRLFIDKDSMINRSSEKFIQLHLNNEVQSLESRLQLGDCKVHCSRNNDAIVILKEISNGGNRVHLKKLSPSTRNTLQRLLRLFTNENRLRGEDDDDDVVATAGCYYERLDEGKVCEFQKEINEKWLMQQVVDISSHSDSETLAKVLMDFKSEIKLKTIFNAEKFSNKDVLGPCLDIGFHSMITSFQNNCVQYNPHINYMNVNPLLRVTLQVLLRSLELVIEKGCTETDLRELSVPILSLMTNLGKLETTSLLYIKTSAIEKFIHEQLLKSQVPIAKLLIEFAAHIAKYLKDIFDGKHPKERVIEIEIQIFLRCLDAIIRQKFVWTELNQPLKYERHLNSILDMLHEGMTRSIRNTIFYRQYWLQQRNESALFASGGTGKNCGTPGYVDMSNNAGNDDNKDTNGASDSETRTLRVQKAIFLGKLIEASMDRYDNKIHVKFINSRQLMKCMKSITISVLRTKYYYGLAVVPYELFRTFSYDKQMNTYAKLPSIPVDHLSDVDILQKFIKRLSIFGFSTRQQFEEYFMTFLLLINRIYDVNMVDEQEQFLIKNACLTVIIELLILCRTFPFVGNKLSKFQHTTRWPRIKCRNNISLKKLHKIQLIIPGSNVFYHPNLERDLSAIRHDSIIGTNYFLPNQYELNHVWQQMESLSNEAMNINSDAGVATGIGSVGSGGDGARIGPGDIDGIKEDTAGIDLKSSCQLIFDVFTQIIEQNHVLVLPNLVKFCEICDNREHIRWIKNTVMKLQEQIPFDDTISHQYIIYLLCRTQSILVPSFAELSHLCSIISTYLKSTHIFIRNATLHGLLCLLECCTKTTTTLGKLSEELCLLREIIVGYITHHGIVEESPTVFSEMHTKLVWTLNFSLIEMTSKFVPDCHLLSNTIISANNLLKRTTDEAVYLCIIHGLERIMVVNTTQKPICDKVEKLALELVKVENERFSLPALKLLLSCVYIGSSKQLETTEHSNGIVQDDPEIIAQQTEKVDVLLHRIKSSTSSAARIYGEVLCQIVRDLVPPNEILTKVIKEYLAINQPHCEVIARIVYQVFRSCIDSSYLRMLQDWLICSLPNFLTLPAENSVWCLTIIFLSASINLDLIKLFPFALHNSKMLDEIEILLFMISARDFYIKLNAEQKTRFRDIFKNCELDIIKDMLKCL